MGDSVMPIGWIEDVFEGGFRDGDIYAFLVGIIVRITDGYFVGEEDGSVDG